MSGVPTMSLDDEAPSAESFETARPVRSAPTAHPSRVEPQPLAQKTARNGARDAAASEDIASAADDRESYLLGCFLLDDGATLAKAIESGLSSADFLDRGHALIYATLRTLQADDQPLGLDTLVQALGPRLNDAGGIQRVMAIDHQTTTVRAERVLQGVIDASERRRMERIAAQVAELSANGGDLKDITALLEQAKPRARRESVKPRPITSYAYPSDDDPNMLLGSDDYLGRGGGLLFVSHAGAGKSSWAMDACMMWALGRAWMQIKAHHPRKTLIVQAEDSDRYIGKIFASFAHVNQLTEADLELLKKNCIIVRLKGVSGPAFFAELSRLTTEHQPDLVVINPIYLYAEGDITRSEFAQPFLLGLDAVNRAEKFAYILIHHTGKPTQKQNGKRAEVEDWESAYMGFGSSYLANWPRATILLEPVAGQSGSYQIKLGKGGFNAGVTKQVEQGAGFRDEPVTRIAVRHSKDRMVVNGRERPVFYWEIDPAAVPEEPVARRGGHKALALVQRFAAKIPRASDKAATIGQIHRAVGDLTDLTYNGFKKVILRAYEDEHLKMVERSGLGPCFWLPEETEKP